MPTTVRLLSIALALLLAIHAALAPFTEGGLLSLLPIAVDIALLWLLWAFSRRHPGTLSWLSTYCIVAVVMNALFSPFSSEYGGWAWVVRSQFVAEVFVCVALYFALRAKSTKAWFHGDSKA